MKPFLVLVALVLYFLPALLGGNKRSFSAIFILNLLLGWTFIGWVVALVWATAAEPPAAAPETSEARAMRLKGLRDAGVLSQEEFMRQIANR